jgi:4'-phosphopantetheinyl transferase
MMRLTAWPQLKPGEVHVWLATVREASVHGHTLSAEELLRADRFRHPADRSRYVATRGLLRSLLGMYLGVGPRTLAFTATRFGKPELTGRGPTHDLRFSTSRSGRRLVVALAWGRDVGIDIERCRPELVTQRAIELALPASEAARFKTLAPAARTAKFYQAWTRLEAKLKAMGEGFARTGSRAEAECGSSMTGDGRGRRLWSLVDLPSDTGYAAALAVEGGGYTVRRWTWRGVAELPTQARIASLTSERVEPR